MTRLMSFLKKNISVFLNILLVATILLLSSGNSFAVPISPLGDDSSLLFSYNFEGYSDNGFWSQNVESIHRYYGGYQAFGTINIWSSPDLSNYSPFLVYATISGSAQYVEVLNTKDNPPSNLDDLVLGSVAWDNFYVADPVLMNDVPGQYCEFVFWPQLTFIHISRLYFGANGAGSLLFSPFDLDLGGYPAYSINPVNFVQTNPLPEPATMLLLVPGLLGLAGFRYKKMKKTCN